MSPQTVGRGIDSRTTASASANRPIPAYPMYRGMSMAAGQAVTHGAMRRFESLDSKRLALYAFWMRTG